MKKREISWLAISFAGATMVYAQAPGERGPGGPPEGRQRPSIPLIDALDKDHDRVISADEIEAASTALLTLDKNGDGKLSEDEFVPSRTEGRGPGGPEGRGAGGPEGRGPGGPEGRGAGGPEGRGPGGQERPSPERFVEHAMQFDANGDEKLDRDELMKFASEMQSHRPDGPMSGGPEGRGPGGPGGREGRGADGERGPNERPRRPAPE